SRTQLYTIPLHHALPISDQSKAVPAQSLQRRLYHLCLICANSQMHDTSASRTLSNENKALSLSLHAGVGLAGRALPPMASLCPRSEEHTSELQSRENLVC